MSEIKKISAHTLGCKLNFAETSTIVQKFIDSGYEFVPFGQEVDLTIINTCTVTNLADKKSRKLIHKASRFAKDIIVIGCSAQLHTKKYSQYNKVRLVAGLKDKFKVFDLYHQNKNKTSVYSCDSATVKTFDHAFSIKGRTRSFLKVQDGCSYNCSYCIIPKARGLSRSPQIEDIIKDAQNIVEQGFKEIVITGVNIGDFGRGTDKTFYDLLVALDKQVDIPRIRISSIEPELLKDEIISLIAQSDKFLPHFHIPLQSGSNEILRLMRRRYNTQLFYDRITTIKKIIPDAFIGIDVIVGFPGETDNLFKQTLNFLNDLPFSFLHIFPYSDRPNTIASNLPNKIPTDIKNQREYLLKTLSNKKHSQFYKEHLNKKYNVLFEAKNKNNKILGFTDNYIKVQVNYDPSLINQIRRVKLEHLSDNNTVIASLI